MKHSFLLKKDYDFLSQALSEELAFLSLSIIKKQMRLGEVRVNGVKVLKDTSVLKGEEVKIFLPKANDKTNEPLDIVFENDIILAINKPILCEVETHLAGLVNKTYPNAMPLHRLDRNTKGLVLFSKNNDVHDKLLKLFKDKKIKKYYRAHVVGVPKIKKAEVTVYLKKMAEKSLVLVSNAPKKGYSEAVLNYEVIEEFSDNTSILDILLITGKTHQIRATLSHLGHPIIGDGKYGNDKANRSFNVAYQRLLAYKIEFLSDFGDNDTLKSLKNKQICLKSCEIIKKM